VHCEAETYRLYPDKNATERPSGRATGPVGGRAEPFFVTAHYNGHPLVLVRPEKLDLEWAKANLIRVWRAQAPRARILLPGSAVRTGVPVPVCPAQHLQRFNLRPTCWR
jgi:hypothetical protein